VRRLYIGKALLDGVVINVYSKTLLEISCDKSFEIKLNILSNKFVDIVDCNVFNTMSSTS